MVESAPHPARPVSRLGIAAPPFVLRSADPYKAGLPDANFTFRYSYGDPQPVAVLARRSLGPVTLRFRVDGGPRPQRAHRRVAGRRALPRRAPSTTTA